MYFTFCFSVWWHSLLDLHKWKIQLDNRNARVKRYILNILFSSVCICDSRIATQRHFRRSVLSAEPSPLLTHTHAFNCALLMSVCTRLHGEPLVVKALAHPSLRREEGQLTRLRKAHLVPPRAADWFKKSSFGEDRKGTTATYGVSGGKGRLRMNGGRQEWCLLGVLWYQIPRQRRPGLHPFPFSSPLCIG